MDAPGIVKAQENQNLRHNCDGDLELMAGFEPATAGCW